MEKKIIAIVMVTVLIITCFAACKKQEKTVKDDSGKEFVVVTDKEGNTVLNEDGEIYVYVTDENGDFLKDENGERQTNVIDFPKKLVSGLTYETPEIKFIMPAEDWTLGESGKFIKNNTDENVFLNIKNLGKLDAGYFNSLHLFVEKEKSDNDQILDEIKKTYPDSKAEITSVKITDKQVNAEVLEFVVKDTDGKMVYYAHGTYFLIGDEIFKAEYICNSGEYYDESFNLIDVINQGLTIKK